MSLGDQERHRRQHTGGRHDEPAEGVRHLTRLHEFGVPQDLVAIGGAIVGAGPRPKYRSVRSGACMTEPDQNSFVASGGRGTSGTHATAKPPIPPRGARHRSTPRTAEVRPAGRQPHDDEDDQGCDPDEDPDPDRTSPAVRWDVGVEAVAEHPPPEFVR